MEGLSFSVDGSGVKGTNIATSGLAIGLEGDSNSPQGTAGFFINSGSGNLLIGEVGPDEARKRVFRVNGEGTVFAKGGFRFFGADFAESMPVARDRASYEAGDVLVIDRTGTGRLALENRTYSTLVAGVYSTHPGALAGRHRLDDADPDNEVPLAIVGIVPCKATAENGPIEVGDLLVTSSTEGHVMKGTDRSRMVGAIVGKALEPLPRGKGVIQVLVTLQ